MMQFKEIRLLSGLSQIQFSEKYHIPRRTIQNWESEKEENFRKCPDYLLLLLERAVREDFDCK